MAKAVLCPVCSGSGKSLVPPPGSSTDAAWQRYPCHGCGGRGWVEVAEDSNPPPNEK